MILNGTVMIKQGDKIETVTIQELHEKLKKTKQGMIGILCASKTAPQRQFFNNVFDIVPETCDEVHKVTLRNNSDKRITIECTSDTLLLSVGSEYNKFTKATFFAVRTLAQGEDGSLYSIEKVESVPGKNDRIGYKIETSCGVFCNGILVKA
jgi:hypothetical protein